MEKRLAEAALERFGLGNARLEPLRLGGGFTQVLRATTARDQRFVLKLYSPPPSGGDREPGVAAAQQRTAALLRSPEVLASQLGWLSDLGREADLRVPEPVPLPDGSSLGRVSTRDLSPRGSLLRWTSRRRDAEELMMDLRGAPRMPRHFVLLRWVPGEHKRGEDLTARDISLVGSYLARLHHHAEGYCLPEGTAFPRWDWGWAFGPSAPLWSKGQSFYSEREMETFRTVALRVLEDLECLGEEREVFGLVHRDTKLENLVFEGGEVGAIDFDMSGLGYYLFDFRVVRASLVHHHGGRLKMQQHRDRLEMLWAAFLEGYEHKRPLPENHERYLWAFDAMQKVAAVNRQLGLLDSEGSGRRPARFLKNAATWLEESSKFGKPTQW